MEITHLRYFKKTAELEHITKAAQELHVAQPSLSRTISMLEDELKVKLFNRKGKSIELNEYGIIVLNHTNRILKELEAIHRTERLLEQHFKVATMPTLRTVTQSCGISLRLAAEDYEPARKMVAESGLSPQMYAIYLVDSNKNVLELSK